MAARFSIGIDLGTTNSALAYVPLDGDARPEAFAVPQWETSAALGEAPTLPSFLYLPEEAGAAAFADFQDAGGWIVGRLARRRAGETPGRVVRSAKSWLCHHSADRTAPILPWGSEDLSPAQKISPVRAAALVLRHLKDAWDSRFAASGAPFDAQDVTVTVPASFDAAAQRLTLVAAAEAGFPAAARLLEEPQAAFYSWLEGRGAAEPLWEGLDPNAGPRHVLIVDIGGGTSDFSLFELTPGAAGAAPEIRRVAVSDHILLGGDNMDLALAALMEPRLAGERGGLSGPQWDHLVASCRDVKERALTGDRAAEEQYVLALPGRGSGLLSGARTAKVQRDEVEDLVLDGFFPACDALARPFRTQSGLRDWGLPYAADSAITRHLADFLAGRPRVDAVLFNGGALHAAALRARLIHQIAVWQDGARPVELVNAEPDLAVARGAARFGKLLHRPSGRIAAGAGRAVFLAAETAGKGERPALICVLPIGAAPEQAFTIDLPGLELRTGRPVSFRAWSSTRHGDCRPGDVVRRDADSFQALPELQTVIETAEGAGADSTVPVRLTVRINALGLLQIACVGTDPRTPGSWPLEFNLRPHEHGRARAAEAAEPVAPNAAPAGQQAARDHLAALFTRPLPKKSDRLTANGVLKALERIVGLPRKDWNAALLRNLWPALNDATLGRKLSVEHEEAWLELAGFLLRPGFGFAGDGLRMDDLWRLRDTGLAFPGKRSKVQEAILWRRVAGGLSAERQETLLSGDLDAIHAGTASPEIVRLAGSLERLPRETKADLIETFLAQALARAEAKQHCAPHLAALGLLLNRTPLTAGPEDVLPPDLVERAFASFQKLDWGGPELTECCNLFLRAARVVDDRNLDVPRPVRDRIARKLEAAGVAQNRIATIRMFTPVGRSDGAALYGEALPAGLVLGGGLD